MHLSLVYAPTSLHRLGYSSWLTLYSVVLFEDIAQILHDILHHHSMQTDKYKQGIQKYSTA